MKQNSNAQPVQDVIRKLRFSFKEKGMLIGGSMFDKDESAKVILDATTGRNDTTNACDPTENESSDKT